MKARIFSRRSDADVKLPRRITRRTRMLNQISIWFSHDVCFGTYTKRIRWLAFVRNAFRVATDFRTPLFPFTPRPSDTPHASATPRTKDSEAGGVRVSHT